MVRSHAQHLEALLAEPTPTKKPTPERHGTHAALPESKSAPATYGTKKPAPIREPPKEKPSLVQRGLNAAQRGVPAHKLRVARRHAPHAAQAAHPAARKVLGVPPLVEARRTALLAQHLP